VFDSWQKQKIYFTSRNIQTGSGAYPASKSMNTMGSLPGGKAAGHSPPSTVAMKNMWSSSSILPVCLHSMQGLYLSIIKQCRCCCNHCCCLFNDTALGMWHEHQQVLKSTIFIARTLRTSNLTSQDLSERVHLKQHCSLINIPNKRVEYKFGF